MQSFTEGLDIHARTASEIFGIPLDEVTDNHRRVAKTINFGIMYGMGPHKLSQELGIKRDVAKLYIDNYLAKYPRVKEYMDAVSSKAEEDGCVTTLLGRRRSHPRDQVLEFQRARGGQEDRHQHPDPGNRGRHHQDGHGEDP